MERAAAPAPVGTQRHGVKWTTVSGAVPSWVPLFRGVSESEDRCRPHQFFEMASFPFNSTPAESQWDRRPPSGGAKELVTKMRARGLARLRAGTSQVRSTQSFSRLREAPPDRCSWGHVAPPCRKGLERAFPWLPVPPASVSGLLH